MRPKYKISEIISSKPRQFAGDFRETVMFHTKWSRSQYYDNLRITMGSKREIGSQSLDFIARLLGVPVEELKNYTPGDSPLESRTAAINHSSENETTPA